MAQSVDDTRDADGNLIRRVIVADDGTEITNEYTDGRLTSQVLVDLPDVQSWTRIERTFDSAGTLREQSIETDSGRIITRVFDAFGVLVSETLVDDIDNERWSSIVSEYDPTGAVTSKTVTSDTGDITTTTFLAGVRTMVEFTDGSATRSWDRLVIEYDSSGAVTQRTFNNDDGLIVTLAYTGGVLTSRTLTDPTAGQAGGPNWTEIETTFDASGNRQQVVSTQDNGDILTTDFTGGVKSAATVVDADDDAPWTSIRTEFNAAGERVQQIITYDDGNEVLNRFINADPVADDESAVTPAETSVEIDVLDGDTDADGDTLTITGVTQGTGGLAEINENGTPGDPSDDTITFTPDAGFSGEATFSYTISDGFGGTATGNVSVTVEPSLPPGTLFSYGFETAGNGSVYTTSVGEFTDGNGDFFTRSDGSNIGSFVEYTGQEGGFYFAAMDTDGSPGTERIVELNIDDIDITSAGALTLSFLLAEDDDGTNQDWDGDSSFTVEARIDDGSYVQIFAVESSAETGFNTEPRVDTDFDGVGDGDALTSNFETFTAAIAGSGAALDLRFTFTNLDAGDEDIAIDAITVTSGPVAPESDPLINEFVVSHDGIDDHEFIEIFGDANIDYSRYTLLEVEGDITNNAGVAQEIFQLGTTDANGLWWTGFQTGIFQNGTASLLLVEDFTGTRFVDLDTDDDGTIDVTPWTRIVDSIAVNDGDPLDFTYGDVELVRNYDGFSTFYPGGASRIPDGTETNTPEDWVRNDFFGAGLPALDPGTPDFGEAFNTPGAPNRLIPEPTPIPEPTLLLSEVVVTPTGGEFIEIYNATDATIDLSDVYLTDATFARGGTFFSNLPTGSNAGGGGFGDFLARFPELAMIAPGEYQTIAMVGSDDFSTEYGFDPTYELFEDGGAADGVADMREALPGSINNQGGLTNSGEMVALFQWDGTSDLVQDLDYVIWGDAAEAVDKTGVSIDGPDADTDASTYADETPTGAQDLIDTAAHASGNSFQRIDFLEGAETQTGGNGVNGADETSEDLSNTWVSDRAATPGAAAPDPVDPTDPTALLISEIQGSGSTSARVGEVVSVQAVVTYTMSNGFFMQEEDADADADALTSEGIFVFTGSAPTVTVGDLVDVIGTVNEFAPDSSGETETQITPSSVIVAQSGVALPGYASLTLDPASAPNLEALEGMLVSVDSGTSDPLTLVTNFNFDRYAEFVVSPGVQVQPTQVFDAQTEAADVAALAQANANSQLLIDDGLVGNGDQNPSEFRFIPNTTAGDDGDGFLDSGDTFDETSSTFRLGTEFTAPITGVLDFGTSSGFDSSAEFRVHLDAQVSIDESTNSGARPDAPDVGGGLQVAAFNVLNYFDTPTDGGATNPAGQERGASTAADVQRQADKLAAAILDSGADVIALQEIENSPTALAALAAALQAESDARAVAAGTDIAGESPDHDWQGVTYTDDLGAAVTTIGTDAIATGLMYNAAEVQNVDSDFHIFEEASADVTSATLGITDLQRNRPVTAATFTATDENGNPVEFTVASVHFKSKGDSGLDAFDGNADPNVDQGDGQGYWNQARTDAANELKAWLEGTNTDPADNYLGTGVASGNVLVMGDFNAYSQEDPSQVFNQDADYVDLLGLDGSNADAFSFVFDGQQGALDQAFATDDMAAFVTGVEEWHINAQEPDLLSYNSRFTDAAFFGDNVFASSDHDPLIVGLNLNVDLPLT